MNNTTPRPPARFEKYDVKCRMTDGRVIVFTRSAKDPSDARKKVNLNNRVDKILSVIKQHTNE